MAPRSRPETIMAKLNDTQTILLSTASRRDDHNLHPLPATLSEGVRVTKAIAALVKAGLAEARDTGTFATEAGLTAIGVETGQGADPSDSAAAPEVDGQPEPASRPRTTKIDGVLILLRRPEGTTLAELIAATGWLPHTTRAALTGLRKKGHAVTRGKRDGATCYQVVEAV